MFIARPRRRPTARRSPVTSLMFPRLFPHSLAQLVVNMAAALPGPTPLIDCTVVVVVVVVVVLGGRRTTTAAHNDDKWSNTEKQFDERAMSLAPLLFQTYNGSVTLYVVLLSCLGCYTVCISVGVTPAPGLCPALTMLNADRIAIFLSCGPSKMCPIR